MLDELTEPGTTTVMENGETMLVQFNETGRAYEINSKGNIGEPIVICKTHTYSEADWVIDIQATCTEAGKKHVNCTTCGIRIKQEEIEAKGHNYSEATCIAVSTCSICGETRGDLLEHNYSQATCTKLATCSICGGTKGTLAEHNYVNGKCTMCNSNVPITASAIANATDKTQFYGKTVNYGVSYSDASTFGNSQWEIFYADENNIYIITRGHLANGALSISGYNGTSDFTAGNLESKYPAVKAGLLEKTYDPTSVGSELKYSSSYSNMKATQYLLDSTVWADYAPKTNNFADWAIGGPTLELFVKSYNSYYPDKEMLTCSFSGSWGYARPNLQSIPVGTHLCHPLTGYWLASPTHYSSGSSYVTFVFGSSNLMSLGCNRYSSTSNGFRPIVCLKSTVSLTWNETTNQFDLQNET